MYVHVSPSILTRPPRKAKRHETNHQSLSTRLASALAHPPPTNGISLGEAGFVEEKALESAAFPYCLKQENPGVPSNHFKSETPLFESLGTPETLI